MLHSQPQTVGFPAATFQGVSVTFNGTAAALFHLVATAGQIDLLVPCELPASGTVQVGIKTSAETSSNYALTMTAGAPGIYFVADPSASTSRNVLAQFNATAWLAMPASMATALKIPGDCSATIWQRRRCAGSPRRPAIFRSSMSRAWDRRPRTAIPAENLSLPARFLRPMAVYSTRLSRHQRLLSAAFLPTSYFPVCRPVLPDYTKSDFEVPAGVTGKDVPAAVSISGSPEDTRTVAVQLR